LGVAPLRRQRPRAWAAASGGRVRCVPWQRTGQPLFPQGVPLIVQRCMLNGHNLEVLCHRSPLALQFSLSVEALVCICLSRSNGACFCCGLHTDVKK
ncbi:unnamed protein product, partial [Ectocarpus fasciculatus]